MSPVAPQPQGTNPMMGGGAPQGQPMPPQMPMQPQMPMPPMEDPAAEQERRSTATVDKFIEQKNIAKDLDKEKLEKIGDAVYAGYKRDLQSKEAWDGQVDEWVKLAAQVKEDKSFPWPKSSNVKYPLLATAAMQFAARAYPSLVPADGKIVQFKVVGSDPAGQKSALADKLAKHMNYQLLEDMEDWEEEMDRALILLPIVGCLFKKTYFDPIRKRNASKLVGPKDLIVNHWATSLESAHRKTEILPMTKNQIKSYQNAELYLDVELPDPRQAPELATKVDVHGNEMPTEADDTTPYVILEQHTFWDLDDDGYQEPYIITIEEQSKKVLRIVARFDSDGIIEENGNVIAIEPVEYYTKYGFIPNPDGGFYDIGFGHLLGPLNESVNTLINQLVDAGTLSNLQAGFIGKGLNLKLGENRFTPGEWKQVNATGDDIKKQVFPLPVNQPSDVLFKLLGMMVDSGRELASVAEIFTGKMPGQNTPATTTQASIEQGMKVFTAIYKRVYRAMTKEYKKLFRLNSLYEENFERAMRILDEPITPADYNRDNYDVCPTADPTAVSTTQKMMKVQQLGSLISLGTINVMEFTKRVLEAQEQPNIQAIMQEPQPQVDPKVQAVQAKMEMDKEKHQMDLMAKQMDLQFKQQEALMDQKFMEMEAQMKMQLEKMKFDQQAEHQMKQSQLDMYTGRQELEAANMEHKTTMVQSQQKHDITMQQTKEKAALQKEQMNAKAKQAGNSAVGKSSGNKGSKGSNSGKN